MTPSGSNKSGLLARLLSATPDQSRDTGLAMVLLCLLSVYFWGQTHLVPVAMVLLVLTMAWPNAFRPLAFFWFGLSHFMGNIVSKVILSILFFLVVTPIGLIRRLAGADSLQLKKWKKDGSSVFKVRDGVIKPEDLANPY